MAAIAAITSVVLLWCAALDLRDLYRRGWRGWRDVFDAAISALLGIGLICMAITAGRALLN